MSFIIGFETLYLYLEVIKNVFYDLLDKVENTGDDSSVKGIVEIASFIGFNTSGNVTNRIPELRGYLDFMWQWISITYGKLNWFDNNQEYYLHIYGH